VTYYDTEDSVQDNKPIELYAFSRLATGQVWYYTSSPDPITFQTNTYEPIVIGRSKVEQTEELDKSSLEIDITFTADLVLLYISEVIIDPIDFTLFRENAGGWTQQFSGRVDSISASEPMSTITCVPIAKALENVMLHLTHSIQCPYTLFDGFTCRANRGSFLVSGNVASSDGATIEAAEFATKPDGWLNGGEIVSGGTRRMILTHIGNQVQVSPRMNIEAGDAYEATAGCAHSTTDCLNKFANLDNFGGEPYIPTKDPWKKRIV